MNKLKYITGGPHSVFLIDYMLYAGTFALLGYTLVLVNYRGSLGFGEDSVRSLASNVGTLDIQDTHLAATQAMKKEGVDASKLIAYGGSHGGFISLHMIGQYPVKFKKK
jgi:acylaminoacyl-peptidase